MVSKNKTLFKLQRTERLLLRFFAVSCPFAIFLMAFLVLSSPFGAASVRKNLFAGQTGEILVKLRDKAEVYRVRPFANLPLDEIAGLYAANPWVEYAEPNAKFVMSLIPNDPEYGKLWYLPQINAPGAWDQGTGSEDVIVAVLDTGVDLDNPDLKDNIWVNTLEIPGNGIDDDRNSYIDDVHGWNFVDGSNDPNPQLGLGATYTGMNHGTVVAGIIGAVGNNNLDGAGVAWRVRIMPLRVLDSRGTGNAANVEQAIDYAIKNGAKILNLSFVGSEKSITLDRAIERAYSAGILIVVAAGNFSTNGSNGIDMDVIPLYPACSDGPSGENWVLAVAALDTLDQKLAFSNYGRCVDIAAPGIGIYNAQYQNQAEAEYASSFGGSWRGTSMAAPQVSGAAALLRSIDVSFTNTEIRDLLISNSSPVDSVNPSFRGKLGNGRLDVGAAMRAAIASRTSLGTRTAVPTSESRYVVAPASKSVSEVRVMARDGSVQESFLAYAPGFKGGVSVAVGDLDGDGSEEIVTGAGAGGGPHIRIFSTNGTPLTNFFAFETSYRGGVRVAVLDYNGDGIKEIAVASGKAKEGEVRIFNREGSLLARFFVFSKKFKNGFSIAAGDINGDGIDEVLVAAGPGGGPHVQAYKTDGTLVLEFFAYERQFGNGVEAIALDIDGDGTDEIATAPASGKARNIKIFDERGNALYEFQAFDLPAGKKAGSEPGLRLAVFDFDNDKRDEIVAGNGPGGDPTIRVFTPDGLLFAQLDAYGADMRGGVNIGVLQR